MSRSTKPVHPTTNPVSPASASASGLSAAGTATATNTDINPATRTSTALKRRKPGPAKNSSTENLGRWEKGDDADADADVAPMAWTARNRWMVYAVASGACAAFNGVFAKLTTNDLTGHIARGISGAFGIESVNGVLEVIVRCTFFGLNLLFNGIMWTFFTQALAKGTSTTQVSIMNTSTNFVITALLGLVVFAESLPPLWWAGAALLVAGNVVIGRQRGDDGDGADGADAHEDGDAGVGVSVERDEEDEENAAERGRLRGFAASGVRDGEDVPLLGDLDGRVG